MDDGTPASVGQTVTRREEIKARLAAATQLPWKVYQGDVICYTDEDYDRICDDVNPDDADLIANAPADLRYLEGLLEQVGETVSNMGGGDELALSQAAMLYRLGYEGPASTIQNAVATLRAVRAILKGIDNDD